MKLKYKLLIACLTISAATLFWNGVTSMFINNIEIAERAMI